MFNASPTHPSLFLLHKEHEEFLLGGKGRLTFPDLFSVIVTLIMCLVISAMLFTIIRENLQEQYILRQLGQSGTQTTAMVVDRRTESGSKGPKHFITYQFDVEQPNITSVTYRREQRVSKTVYNQGVNVPIDIIFMDDDPSISRLSGAAPDYFPTICFSPIFLLVATLVLFVVWEYIQKNDLKRADKSSWECCNPVKEK